MKKCENCGRSIRNTQPHVHYYTDKPHNYHVNCWLKVNKVGYGISQPAEQLPSDKQ